MVGSTSGNPVDAYALAVRDGHVPAGKYQRLACIRHLRDRERESTDPSWPYRFVWEARDGTGRLKPCALRFLEFARQLRHYKGRQFAGKPFEPTPNQVFRLGSIFGWRHAETGYRRFTTAYNELPRKNGKTFEAAAVALYVTFFEGEAGAEGYTVATKRDQARRVFDDAKKMVKSSGLVSRIKANASNLHREDTSSKLEPLGADADSTDGLNPHFIGTDELHAWKVRDLLDVMESATGARVNPLHFQITTAGDDLVSPCGDQHTYACQILDGVLEDDPSTLSFFAFIASADEGDDPWSEETWKKANPHWGISVEPEDMRKLAAKAMKMPSAAAEFKQKRLNLWVNATAPCLSVEGWRKGQSKMSREAFEASLKGQACYVGVDLASKIDLCALSLVFPPTEERKKWAVVQRLWTPEATIEDRAHRDRAPYDVWVDQGWLKTTPDTRIDHNEVILALRAFRQQFQIMRIGFDPWHADKVIEDLKKEPWLSNPDEAAIEIPQTYPGMSSACLRVQADILAGEFDANSCPVTSWSVSNTAGGKDGKDNLMFVKGKSRGRIDPVIAMTMGAALWLKFPPVVEPTYEIFFAGGQKRR
jgi:phage terminase large subunit-like protein